MCKRAANNGNKQSNVTSSCSLLEGKSVKFVYHKVNRYRRDKEIYFQNIK